MSLRLLLVSGTDGGGGTLPPDPTLVEPRHFTGTLGINQNVFTIPGGAGSTYRTTYPVIEDTASITLAYSGYSQGEISSPMAFKVVVEVGSEIYPLTFGGQATATLMPDDTVESDPLPVLMLTGSTYALRLFAPGGQTININANTTATTVMAGEHLTDAWSGSSTGSGGPMPIAAVGSCRESVVVPAVLGDSIAAQGRDAAGWIRRAAVANNLPVLAYGRNVMRFTSPWPGGDTLRAATHLLVQYGVNDMSATPSVATMWDWALGCYDQMQTLNPGIPIWQSTPTPICATNDQCATLEGQSPHGYTTARPPWLAFLRDGAPMDPETRAALSPGADGVRVGQEGHPLQGIVDIAAAVENGGLNGDGKWRVDLGPLGGDGVHPSDLGMLHMTPPVQEWMASL